MEMQLTINRFHDDNAAPSVVNANKHGPTLASGTKPGPSFQL